MREIHSQSALTIEKMENGFVKIAENGEDWNFQSQTLQETWKRTLEFRVQRGS